MEFQDPKMEVLYHIRPYFVGIFPEISAWPEPKIYGRYLQSIGSYMARCHQLHWKSPGFPHGADDNKGMTVTGTTWYNHTLVGSMVLEKWRN